MAANERLIVMMVRLIFVLLFFSCAQGRKHKLILKNEGRKTVPLSTFGFLTGGTLAVNVTLSGVSQKDAQMNRTLFGFTLDKSRSSEISRYMEDMQSSKKCILDSAETDVETVFFRFDFRNKRLTFERMGSSLEKILISNITRDKFLIQHQLHRRSANLSPSALNGAYLYRSVRETGAENSAHTGPANPAGSIAAATAVKNSTPKPSLAGSAGSKASGDSEAAGSGATGSAKDAQSSKTDTADGGGKVAKPVVSSSSSRTLLPPRAGGAASGALLNYTALVTPTEEEGTYQVYFLVYIQREEEEGLYNLYFHNCLSYISQPTSSLVSLTLGIVEDNDGNYLTAGEMPVPGLYFTFSVLFFIAGVAWFSVLRRSKEDVYKIHYLMLVVIFVKSLACLFHGVNMYFIQINGVHEDAWAILWYIVYLTRGALMFVTVLLIGAGWAFIKHVLSHKEKKLFLIIIPLQVLDRIAWVIVEESEEGNLSYTTWREIFILVDLLCCGAILFPVVWSIRHLQEASGTDGKAAINLQKLKLFRHFYILVVCYIYFTRIIVYLMKITLPFKLEWLTDLFFELAMMLFFVVTGIKFRPATDNPYLQVPQDSDDEEIEMEEVLTKTGSTESVVRVNQKTDGADNARIKQRESSHEYD